MRERTAIPWQVAGPGLDGRVLAVLTLAGVLGVAAALPLLTTMQAGVLAQVPLPLPALLTVQLLQSAVLLAGLGALGLLLGGKVSLDAPVTRALVHGRSLPGRAVHLFGVPALLGAGAACVVVLAEATVFAGVLEDAALPGAVLRTPLWQGLLASLYGGITEEILLRLGVFSVLAWLVAALTGRRGVPLRTPALWGVNLAVGVLFGLGHLPATALLAELTGPVVARALVLNLVPSLLFGWLYARRGLESAMAAHLAADIVLQVSAPLR